MSKTLYTTFLFILFATQLIITHAGSSSGSRYSSSNRGSRNYGAPSYEQPVDQTYSQTPKEYLDNKSGFSTFGIICIIFVVIMCCLLFYYGIMCYPFLCRDEKKYRFMDVSSTITAATSRSMQSIEHYPVDSKLEKSCV